MGKKSGNQLFKWSGNLFQIAEPYGLAAADCEQYQYPEDKIDLLPDDWIETHEQVIWDFYVDILEKHKEDLA